MSKLLITVFIVLGVNATAYAQEQPDVQLATNNKEATVKIKTVTAPPVADDVEPVTSDKVDNDNANDTADEQGIENEYTHSGQIVLHILAENNDFYRIDKGQKGIFFVIQDFYISGEKRTDPYLVSDIDQVKKNNFDTLNYDHLTLNGLLIIWFKNGQVEQKGVFDQGKRKGLWVSWYENGQKRSSGHYKEGLKEGPWTVWYQNGRRMQKGYYKTDRRDGVWIYWYGNGRKKEAGRYRQDERVERWSYWSDSGKLIKNIVKEPESTESYYY